MTEDKKTKKLKNICIIIYGFYALSAVLQFNQATLLIGLLVLVIGYILNVDKKNVQQAKDTIFKNHFRWALRTFWIGTAVLLPLATIIATALIMQFTEVTSIIDSLNNQDELMLNIKNYMENDMTKVTLLSMIPMLPVLVWWLRRCWYGYELLKQNKTIENVTSWL